MGPLWVAADGFPSISRSSPTLGLSSPAKNLLQSAKMRLLRSNQHQQSPRISFHFTTWFCSGPASSLA